MIIIRNYERKDASVTWGLKFQTIRNINIRDYSLEQVKAWAPDNFDMDVWQKRIDDMNPFVAELNGEVVGFADLQQDGYIDHFFCHAGYQGIGVGRALMEHIFAIGTLNGVTRYYSAVSRTARPFYERFGFSVVNEQHVDINGQLLTNFVMEKVG
ncbi:GNAT family N-acetyltransferase [Photobacterium chitinilyticum]|uniref:GNAT family N-acetyltransferase n=1 Tax=Photobacterium chitinilyticum TaxID=2485123 RepID=A0A3S3UMJ7_9GAMM|nr:GNAT family N-acetyltransferase [Photobacterium chitinilyticum]RWX57429.1 GNAT family N-acetyltransferase [Photobacterium chitinilyticum]